MNRRVHLIYNDNPGLKKIFHQLFTEHFTRKTKLEVHGSWVRARTDLFVTLLPRSKLGTVNRKTYQQSTQKKNCSSISSNFTLLLFNWVSTFYINKSHLTEDRWHILDDLQVYRPRFTVRSDVWYTFFRKKTSKI